MMTFEPEKITREHILKAVQVMDSEEYEISPSTGYDVIVNDKTYPPKELMRFAHEQATGERLWNLNGGPSTNKYLTDLGFVVVEKNKYDEDQTEAQFLELLRNCGAQNVKAFFMIADSLLRNIGISAVDKRLSFNTRDDNRLVVVVGQRYCLACVPEDKLPWHFISTETGKSTETISVKEFDGKPVAYYWRCAEPRDVMERMDGMIAATSTELNRTRKSGFRDNHNNFVLERTMTDQKYRQELYEKAFGSKDSLTGQVWKLGCTWGRGKPNFYDLIKKHSIVISDHEESYYPGDLVLIALGFDILAIGKVLDHPKPALDYPHLKNEFEQYEVGHDEEVEIAPVEWYELEKEDQFKFELPKGIVRIRAEAIKANAIQLWNERNLNYWIFQCNPNDFDFDTAVSKNLLHEWTVSSHKDKIKVGDKVILWLSGKRSGCYALAIVTSEPQETGPSPDSHLWKTTPKNDLKAGIRITHNLLDQPLYTKNILARPELTDLNIGLQGTNFKATRKQFRTILQLIDNTVTQSKVMSNEFPNVILYGPPGTGKTYNAIAEAVRLAAGETFNNHGDAKKRFDELRAKERIQFVTFHQNYSYEDFILGLKPDLDAASSNLKFVRKEGVFYRLARNAENNYIQSKTSGTGLRPFDEIFDQFLEPLQKNGEEIEIQMASGTTSFWLTEVNDYNLSFRKQSGGESHTLSFATIEELYYKKRTFTSGLRYYYEPLLNKLWELGQTNVTQVKLENYVLVIDEINRANISRVFGELITLLEPDKRIGKENELRVSIPNSETLFGVPPNLFVIGTMNTADKSIALVDIALRRRFQFIGFYPSKDKLQELVNSGKLTEKCRELLEHINGKVLEQNKSADFLIGHAYFIDEPDNRLKEVLQWKVIPLLMEYFSGKTEIVEEILSGCNTPLKYKKENFRWE